MKTTPLPVHARLALPLVASACLAGCLDPNEPGNLVPPTVDEDPSLPALELNGTRLFVDVVGPAGAPAVLVLHGGPGNDVRYMRSIAEPVDGRSLADDYRLVFWDQRGTGLSRRHDEEELSLARYLDDVDALADATSPSAPVLLLGHSWGGALAAAYMARRPGRVAGAVLVNAQALTRAIYDANPAPFEIEPWTELLNDPLWAREVLTPGDHAAADFALAAMFGSELEDYGNKAATAGTRPGAAVFKYLNQDWDEPYDFAVGLERFTRPVLLVGGTDDRILGYEFQRRAHLPLFPRAELLRLEHAGHSDPFTVELTAMIAAARSYFDAAAP